MVAGGLELVEKALLRFGNGESGGDGVSIEGELFHLLFEEMGKEGLCPGALLVEVDEDQCVRDDEEGQREERKEQGFGKDGSDENRCTDEGPEGHEEEGHDMGMDADRDGGPVLGIYKMAVGDGLPGVVPGEDAADDETIGIEAADVGAGCGGPGEEWEILAGLEVGFEALADLRNGEGRR